MCSAGILLFLVALWAAKTDIPRAGGLDKIVVLSNLCFAIPLAVFGAEHLSGARFIMLAVPSYMPWRLFWAYFVGFALLSASLSIATKIQVRWSGLLFGRAPFDGMDIVFLRQTRCAGKRKARSLTWAAC